MSFVLFARPGLCVSLSSVFSTNVTLIKKICPFLSYLLVELKVVKGVDVVRRTGDQTAVVLDHFDLGGMKQ